MPGSRLFPALLADTLELALARFLALDPHSSALLLPLQGKVLALRVLPFSGSFYLYTTATAVQIHRHFERAPDVVFTGTPWAFAQVGLSARRETSLFGSELRVEGDMDTARGFRTLLEALHIDWEGQLAGALGEGVAANVFGVLRTGQRWGRESLASLGLNLSEYWQEESRELPANTEVDGFLRDVDTLRADCDRLAVRIERLAEAVQPSPASGSGTRE